MLPACVETGATALRDCSLQLSREGRVSAFRAKRKWVGPEPGGFERPLTISIGRGAHDQLISEGRI